MKKLLLSVIIVGTYASLFMPLIIFSGVVYPFVLPKTVFFYAMVEIIFLAWILLAAIDKKFRPKEDVLLYAVLLFVGIMALASYRGINGTISFWSTFERMGGMITFIHGFLYFIVLSSVFRGIRQWRGLLLMVVFVGGAVAAIFFWGEHLFIPLPDARAGSTIGNSSFFGAYAVFPLFFAAFLALKGKFNILKIAAAACFVLIFAAIFYSSAKAAFFTASGGSFLIFISWLYFGIWNMPARRSLARPAKPWRSGGEGGESRIWKMVSKFPNFALARRGGQIPNSRFPKHVSRKLAVLLLVAGIIAGSFFAYGLLTKDAGIKARTLVWESAWKAAAERPVLGWGPENFNVAFFKYYNPCMAIGECGGEVWFDHSHSIVFDTLVDAGFAGLLAYLSIFAAAIYLIWRRFIKHASREWLLPSVLTALLATYFLQNLFVFDMPASYVMFFFTLAFISGVFGKDEGMLEDLDERPARAAARSVLVSISQKFKDIKNIFRKRISLSLKIGEFMVLLCLVVAIGATLYFFPFRIIKDANLTHRFVSESMPTNERARLYTSSLAILPLGNAEATRGFLSQVTSWLNRGVNVSDDIIALAQSQGEKAVKENPGDLRVFRVLGDFYIATTRFMELHRADTDRSHKYLERARDTLERATALSPKHQKIIPMLAQVYIFERDYKSAKNILQDGIDLEPRYPDLYWNLAEVYMLQKNWDEAGRKLEEALSRGYSIARDIEKVADLARAYSEEGNYEQAIFWYKKIVDVNPRDPEAHWTLATFYMELGEHEKAKEQALIVKQLDGQYGEAVNSFIGKLR